MSSASDLHELREIRYRIREAEERKKRAQACAREIMAADRRSNVHLDNIAREHRITDIILKYL